MHLYLNFTGEQVCYLHMTESCWLPAEMRFPFTIPQQNPPSIGWVYNHQNKYYTAQAPLLLAMDISQIFTNEYDLCGPYVCKSYVHSKSLCMYGMACITSMMYTKWYVCTILLPFPLSPGAGL